MKVINYLSKKFMVSLRAGMSIIFTAIFLITTVAIIFITSLSIYQAVFFLTKNLITSTSTSISSGLSKLLAPASSITTLSKLMLEDKTVDSNNINEVIEYTKDILKISPEAEVAQWGTETGSYVVTNRNFEQKMVTQYFDQDQILPKIMVIHWNNGNQMIKQELANVIHYDARLRPWYKIGKNAGLTSWSNLFKLYWENGFGVSSSSPFYLKNKLAGVFSIDIQLSSLSDFLNKHKISKNGITFIVDKSGLIIAHTQLVNHKQNDVIPLNINAMASSPTYTAFKKFQEIKKTIFTFNYNNHLYIASFTPVQEFSKYHWYIGIVAPLNDFIGSIRHFNWLILLILFFLLIIGLNLISLFSKRISIPINNLANDLEKIQFFHVKPIPSVKTHIKEIYTMSNAIEAMKAGLESFRRYVPENLIRQLIASGEAAKIGGSKRDVAVFFSDIINFTGIAEKLGPEKVMQKLCDYFDEMTHIIAENHGTIDKYIGDSIMAYWGAPLSDPHSIERCCKAALECQSRLRYLNNPTKIAFPTRIGIHFGSAVVGNLGSTERMNYTAIGDVVNTTSRLEQMNKFYGTHIIVSESVYTHVADLFYFRILDQVLVKGKKKSMHIYELISTKNSVDSKTVEFCNYYSQAFDDYKNQEWEKAIKFFEQALCIKPDDFATNIMMNRCRSFLEKPPEGKWDGIWRYTIKK